MEGLIPFVYRAIVHYANGEQPPAVRSSAWFDESPSSSFSYMRLPGESGRFRQPEIQLLASPPAAAVGAATPPGQQTLIRRSTSRRAA